MAIGDAYATAAEYRAQIDKSDDDADVIILRNLKSVSRLIESECGQVFNKDAAATTRIYRPSDPYSLSIEPVVSVSSVLVDTDDDGDFDGDDEDGLTVTTQYELWPLNAATGVEARPYDEIRRVDAAWIGYLNRYGHTVYNRVQVTAVHGWPAVPDAIKDACIQLTAILRIESPRATSTVDELSRVVSTSRAANEIIERLKIGYTRSPAQGSFFLV